MVTNTEAKNDLGKLKKDELIEVVLALLTELENNEEATEIEEEEIVLVENPDVAEPADSRPFDPNEQVAVTEDWSSLDADYCQTFWPIVSKHEELRDSEDRVKRYVANVADVFKFRFMVKPEGGFVSSEHEEAFSRSWNSQRLLVLQLAGAGEDSGFILGPVYTEFEAEGWLSKYVPFLFTKKQLGKGTGALSNARQPWNNHADPDRVREDFEDWFKSDRPWTRMITNAAARLRYLDNAYLKLGDNAAAQARFVAENPGYEAPEVEGSIQDYKSHWSNARRERINAILNDPERLARIKNKG